MVFHQVLHVHSIATEIEKAIDKIIEDFETKYGRIRWCQDIP